MPKVPKHPHVTVIGRVAFDENGIYQYTNATVKHAVRQMRRELQENERRNRGVRVTADEIVIDYVLTSDSPITVSLERF